jgi:succinyl-CoA synthetase alpha subunit
MSILLTEKTRVVVQGITGSEGSFHTKQMLDYNTKVVAGVTPGKGGQLFEDKIRLLKQLKKQVPMHRLYLFRRHLHRMQ